MFDQQADDVARNWFFGIAILLGIAGACLIAAMQAAIGLARRQTRSSTD